LQGDKPFYIKGQEKSEHSMAIILCCSQHMEMQYGGKGKIYGIMEGKWARNDQ